MTKDTFLDRQYALSVMAGMNQRYHHHRAWLWTLWDRLCKIAVGVFAVASACVSFVTLSPHEAGWDVASVLVAVFAVVAAIALNVLPLGEWASVHTALFQRWTDLREDVDCLYFDSASDPLADEVQRLRDLEAKAHRICGTEPCGNESKIGEFFEAEKRSREKDSVGCAD